MITGQRRHFHHSPDNWKSLPFSLRCAIAEIESEREETNSDIHHLRYVVRTDPVIQRRMKLEKLRKYLLEKKLRKPMLRENHWDCEDGDSVAPNYFSPPPWRSGGDELEYSKRVVAFYKGRDRMVFVRTNNGCPWIFIAV